MKDDPKVRDALDELEASVDLIRTRLNGNRPRGEILQAAKAVWADAVWLLDVVKAAK